MHGHSAHDGAEYVPKELLSKWKKKDPVIQFENFLSKKKILASKLKEEYEQKISAELDEAVQYAVDSPYPQGEEALIGVYAA